MEKNRDMRNKIHKLCDTMIKIGNENNLESWLKLSKEWKEESDEIIKKISIYEKQLKDLYNKINTVF